MDRLLRLLVLSLGGALGVNARYWLGAWIGRWASPPFPWATFAINVSGSFAIGFLAVLLAHHWPHPLGRLFVVTGFLGGYTTFSAFSYESFQLWEGGEAKLAAWNAMGSVAAGLVAVILGVALARAMTGPTPDPAGQVRRPSGEGGGLEAGPSPTESFLEGESGRA